jgi:hypothetical protein
MSARQTHLWFKGGELQFFVDRVKTIWFEKYFPRFPRMPGKIGQVGIAKESDLDVTIWN